VEWQLKRMCFWTKPRTYHSMGCLLESC